MSTDLSAAAALLRERADAEHPTSWIPENQGDEIVGSFVSYDTATNRNGEECDIVLLQTPEGRRSVWLYGVVLQGKLAPDSTKDDAIKPEPGDFLLIRFDGMGVSTETGNDYKRYTVLDHRGDGKTDEAELAARPSRPLEAGEGDEIPF
jgi:hypothetical protein